MRKSIISFGILLLAVGGCQSTPSDNTTELNVLGSWHIEAIMDQATIDYSPAQLTFAESGQLSGNNSCNTFIGEYTLEGEDITLSSSGNTKRACIDALMNQEQNMLKALPNIIKGKLLNGKLQLLDNQGKQLLLLSRF